MVPKLPNHLIYGFQILLFSSHTIYLSVYLSSPISCMHTYILYRFYIFAYILICLDNFGIWQWLLP